MKLLLKAVRCWPILWQIGLLLVTTQVLANLATGLVVGRILAAQDRGQDAVATDISAPFVLLVKVLEKNDPARLAEAAHAAVLADSRLSISNSFQPLADANGLGRAGSVLLLATENGLGNSPKTKIGISFNSIQPKSAKYDPIFSGYSIGLKITESEWLVFTPSFEGLREIVPVIATTLNILMFLIPMLAAALWVSWSITSPLAELAKAADDFRRNMDAEPIVPKGSSEMRKVAYSFNDMQQHIQTFIEARTRTIAAISHDLRTPLTRMRLRVETLTEGSVQEALIADVKVMEQMTNSSLSYLRSKTAKPDIQNYDLAVLAQTVCDEFNDEGKEVAYDGPDHLVIRGDSAKMIRCFFNLIDNSLKHSDSAKISLRKGSSLNAVLEFSDRGPGIPAARRKILLAPLQRGETGANNGHGLGLSIVRDIVREHGGTIELEGNRPSGLIVKLTIPSGA